MVDAVPGPELRERYDAEHAGVPFLHFRAGDGRQVIVTLDEHVGHRTIGRGDDTDITLGWDAKVSRLHAELEHAGGWWTIVDDGLSRNGTFVNGDRLQGRRRLYDGDTVRVGDTALSFGAPSSAGRE